MLYIKQPAASGNSSVNNNYNRKDLHFTTESIYLPLYRFLPF